MPETVRTTYTTYTTYKTYKEKLRPTPAQEQALDTVLWRCRDLYNAALEQRITAWQRCHVSVSRFDQAAELKAMRAAFPDYAAIHSHVLHDVLARLDKTYQAFFRRAHLRGQNRFPRFTGRSRRSSFHLQRLCHRPPFDHRPLGLASNALLPRPARRPHPRNPHAVP